MEPTVITVAVEGDTDVPVVERVLESVGLETGPVYGLKGKGHLDKQLPGYNNAARHARWLVVRDLNTDAACAPELVQRLLRAPASLMCFRIAVRAMEAWLLADRERMSQFLGVAKNQIPLDPETLADPKLALVNLARKSPNRAIREDMVPVPGTTVDIGPGYTSRLIEFASTLWRPQAAAKQSVSLARCINALRKTVAT